MIGVFYVVDIAPQLAAYIMHAVQQLGSSDGNTVSAVNVMGVAATLLQLALRPSDAARSITKLRTAGLSKVDGE